MSLLTYKCTCGNELEVKSEIQGLAILHPCDTCLSAAYTDGEREGNAEGWDNGYDAGYSDGLEEGRSEERDEDE